MLDDQLVPSNKKIVVFKVTSGKLAKVGKTHSLGMHVGVRKTCLPYNHDLVGLHVCGPSVTLNEPWSLPQYPLLAERARPNEEEEAEEVAKLKLLLSLMWLPQTTMGQGFSKHNADHSPPLGKDKNEIQGLIACFIFVHDHKYGSLYATIPDKFYDSVVYRISAQVVLSLFQHLHADHITSSLKKVWCPLYDKLYRTGAGIVPLDANAAANLKGAYATQIYLIRRLSMIVLGSTIFEQSGGPTHPLQHQQSRHSPGWTMLPVTSHS
ncbi:hypothetical protein DFH29DRAFT_882293 [Suillus ampliporus]|nr:hypothetical protein DFH29DRAFT_882293 [Suillus ampliporus]